MAVPDFQSFFKPLLEIAADGKEHTLKESRQRITAYFKLSQEDLQEILPSGNQTKFENRVAWAKSYFVQAKVLSSPRRGCFTITERGKDLLKKGHNRIDVKILSQFPEFVEFHTSKPGKKESTEEVEDTIKATPEEVLQQAYHNMRNDLTGELVEKVKENSPKFFENLVVDLMVALGYGGSRIDAGKSIVKW